MIDWQASVTQEDFGQLVGVSQRTVSELVARGVLARDDTCGQWLLDYCAHLQAVGTGRASDELSKQRARASRAVADRIELELTKLRSGLAPVPVLEHVLASVAGRIADRLGELRRHLAGLAPEIPAAVADRISSMVEECEQDCARVRLADADRLDRDTDDDDGQGAAD